MFQLAKTSCRWMKCDAFYQILAYQRNQQDYCYLKWSSQYCWYGLLSRRKTIERSPYRKLLTTLQRSSPQTSIFWGVASASRMISKKVVYVVARLIPAAYLAPERKQGGHQRYGTVTSGKGDGKIVERKVSIPADLEGRFSNVCGTMMK